VVAVVAVVISLTFGAGAHAEVVARAGGASRLRGPKARAAHCRAAKRLSAPEFVLKLHLLKYVFRICI